MPDSVGSNSDRPRELIASIEVALLSKGIIVERIEYEDELKTLFVFVSTKGVSTIEIEPLAAAAKLVNAELKAVIDSKKDQLCFYLVLSR
jgi:ribonuclease PH